MSSEKSIVVIGMGNLTRGDDAIGRLALRALATKQLSDIDLIETGGEATQVLEAMAGAGAAILIDACRSGASTGTIHRFDVSREPLPAAVRNFSSHDFGLAAGLELARTFDQLPGTCVVLAIEVEEFTYGAPPSPLVNARFDELLACVEQEIMRIRRAQAS
jgi:hydrogenase maturation protease